jgi:hypothetical protein
MIEYLYDAIRATAGTDITIAAEVVEDNGDMITEGCKLVLHIDDKMISFDGEYKDGIWEFTVPAEITNGLTGRFWYCIKRNDTMLCFKQPIYLT